MRIVCDTNVIVSGLLFGGKARDILSRIARGQITNHTSRILLSELEEVLSRPKFGLQPEQAIHLISLVRETFDIVHPKQSVSAVRADPDDDEVVAVAIESGSEYIVSGDNHLLDLKNWDQISILPPAEFLRKIGE